MKEQAQASTICRYLDQGAEHLPYRVVERLAAARAQAVARLADSTLVDAAAGQPVGSAALFSYVYDRYTQPFAAKFGSSVIPTTHTKECGYSHPAFERNADAAGLAAGVFT